MKAKVEGQQRMPVGSRVPRDRTTTPPPPVGRSAPDRRPRQMIDTGIPWIGQVPEGWKVVRGKYAFSTYKTIVGDKACRYERLALTMKGVIQRSKESNDGLQPEDFSSYQILKEGSLVFKLIDLKNISTSRVGLSPWTGIVSPAYICLAPKAIVCPRFAEMYYLMLWHRAIFNSLGGDGVRSALNASDLLAIPFPLPPLPTQRAIAAYLDGECGKIDALRTKIEAQIADLATYKKSVITEAVTGKVRVERKVEKRGEGGQWCVSFRSSKEMKPSGVEWIGDVPAGWSMLPNKYFAVKRKQLCAKWNHENVLSLTMNGVVVRDLENPVGKMPTTFDGYQYVDDGDLLMCLFDYDVTPRTVGRCYSSGVTSPAYSRFKLDGQIMTLGYMYYYYRMVDDGKLMLHRAKNLRHSFNEEEFGAIKTPIPPLPEQREIAAYLDEKCAAIDAAVAKCREQLTDLASYKKSLIYECVTGKKEVA